MTKAVKRGAEQGKVIRNALESQHRAFLNCVWCKKDFFVYLNTNKEKHRVMCVHCKREFTVTYNTSVYYYEGHGDERNNR